MVSTNPYNKTLIACYLGFITQAITANFAPLLFVTFQNEFDIGLEAIALIPSLFYLTQLAVDYFATHFVDQIGYRTCVVISQLISAIGLILLAVLPSLLNDPYIGLLIAVMLYAIGSGLVEVLVSPIVEACPFDNKEGVMSLLHSFYCWGAVGVILVSTIYFLIFGTATWPILACLWALIPLVNAYNFTKCPIVDMTTNNDGCTTTHPLRSSLFFTMIIIMIAAGACEAAMAQWASAFTESAIGVSKTIGDLVGPCSFAALMGLSRLLYGKFSMQLNLTNTMLACGILCLTCYVMAALSTDPIFALLGCACCGFAVGIMWPGTISLSSQRIPLGGTAMFAYLALAGDLGATLSPSVVGTIADLFGGDLKIGLLVSCLFPLLLILGLLRLKAKRD